MANTVVERLTSTNAIVGGAIALLALASQVKDILKPVTDLLPANVRPFVFPALLAIAAILILRAFLFARPKRSRLLKPDALRLQRDNQDHLVGRQEEIARVIELATRGPLLFVVGESGVGKSALLGAGVAPKLATGGSLLPVYIESLAGPDWDEDAWRLLFLAIQRTLPPGANPAIAGLPAPTKRKPLLASLQAATARTPLIIIDQFDDYQARHWNRFQSNGSWVRAADILRGNSFWRTLASLAQDGKIHVAIVTRSDTALGLESIRFAEPETFTVPRLDKNFIGELIDSITQPAAEGGAVIEAPEAGWADLRDRLIDDLGQTGAVLPQQLKISLLGLATLPRQILSVGAYERAGGTAGLEAEWIRARIKRVETMGGLRDDLALKALLTLISPDEATKTRDLSVEAIITESGIEPPEREALEQTLVQLEADEIVRRRRDPGEKDDRWRLDHDYLTGVLREAERRVNAWTIQLKEGAEALEGARGHPLRQWKALLRPTTQLRFLWDRLRGRFQYGRHRAFAALSGLRLMPAMVLIAAVVGGGMILSAREARRAAVEEMVGVFEIIVIGNQEEKSRQLLQISLSDEATRDLLVRRLLSSRTYIRKFAANLIPLARAMGWQASGVDKAGIAALVLAAMDEYAGDSQMMVNLGDILVALGPELPPEQAAEGARRVLATYDRERANGVYKAKLLQVVANLSPALSRELVSQIASRLFAALPGDEADNQDDFVDAIGALGVQLPSEQAANLFFRLARQGSGLWPEEEYEATLAVLASRLSPVDASRLSQRLVTRMRGIRESAPLAIVGASLSMLGDRLPGDQANQASALLIAALRRGGQPNELAVLGDSVASLQDRSAPEFAASAIGILLPALQANRNEAVVLQEIGGAVGRLHSRLTDDQASQLAAVLVGAMREQSNTNLLGLNNHLASLGDALGSLESRLPADRGREAVSIIIAAMRRADATGGGQDSAAALIGQLATTLASFRQWLPNGYAQQLIADLEGRLRVTFGAGTTGFRLAIARLNEDRPRDQQIRGLFLALADPLAFGEADIMERLGELAHRPFAGELDAYRWLTEEQRQGRLTSIDLDAIRDEMRALSENRLRALRDQGQGQSNAQ